MNSKKTKPVYQSATVWINFVILLVAIFDHDFFSIFGLNDATIAKLMILGVKLTALGNIILRVFITKTGINTGQEE